MRNDRVNGEKHDDCSHIGGCIGVNQISINLSPSQVSLRSGLNSLSVGICRKIKADPNFETSGLYHH